MPIAGTPTADWAENPDLFGEKKEQNKKDKINKQKPGSIKSKREIKVGGGLVKILDLDFTLDFILNAVNHRAS